MRTYHRHLGSLGAVVLALATVAGCSEAGDGQDDFGYRGTGIGVTIAPLNLPQVTDACYSFQILNGAGETVVARGRGIGTEVSGQHGDGGPTPALPDGSAIANPICSSRFGNSQGAVSYVAPCDASAGLAPDEETPINQHAIMLWVNSVCQAGQGFEGGCTPLEGFVNPCGADGCSVTATCVENADVPVAFNFTVMASAQQGFFDVAVNFDNVFCSAKLDTCYDETTEIRLLFEDGARQHTAIAAVACTAGTGPGVDTTLHMTNFSVDCGAGAQVLDLSGVTQEGAVAIGDLTGAVYFGAEDLSSGAGGPGSANKVFTNVAFVLPPTGSCDVRWEVVPADGDTPPQPVGGAHGVFTQVSAVRFSVDGLSRGDCARHPLNGDGSGVATTYVTSPVEYSAQLGFGMFAFAGVGDGDNGGGDNGGGDNGGDNGGGDNGGGEIPPFFLNAIELLDGVEADTGEEGELVLGGPNEADRYILYHLVDAYWWDWYDVIDDTGPEEDWITELSYQVIVAWLHPEQPPLPATSGVRIYRDYELFIESSRDAGAFTVSAPQPDGVDVFWPELMRDHIWHIEFYTDSEMPVTFQHQIGPL